MEAWRRQLDAPVSAFPIVKAGPAHIATLKTFDPPLAALEGRRLAGAERRAKRLIFPTDDGELVLLVHLMTAGRLKYAARGRERAEDARLPARVRGRRAARAHGGRLEEARRRVAAHARGGRRGARAPRPGGARARRRAARRDPRGRLAPAALAPARPASDRRHRPRVGERDPPRRPAVAVRALDGSSTRRRSPGSPTRSTPSSRAGSSCASRARTTRKTYRVHNRLGEPCHVCGTPLARVDFEEHTIYYCPTCQTGGRDAQGPPALAAAPLAPTRPTASARVARSRTRARRAHRSPPSARCSP